MTRARQSGEVRAMWASPRMWTLPGSTCLAASSPARRLESDRSPSPIGNACRSSPASRPLASASLAMENRSCMQLLLAVSSPLSSAVARGQNYGRSPSRAQDPLPVSLTLRETVTPTIFSGTFPPWCMRAWAVTPHFLQIAIDTTEMLRQRNFKQVKNVIDRLG